MIALIKGTVEEIPFAVWRNLQDDLTFLADAG
jgi:hypothetical protein